MQLILNHAESTQTELKRAHQEALGSGMPLPAFSYVQALEQAGGRGRQGRVWTSPPGGLYLSVLLRVTHSHPTWIPHFVAVSVMEALLELGFPSERLRIKWPNDLVVDGTKKLCGILCEKSGEFVFAGIGVNVAVKPEVDREVMSLAEFPLVSSSVIASPFNLLRDTIVRNLGKPFDLPTLINQYTRHSLFQAQQKISWADVGSPPVTPLAEENSVHCGQFLSYGPHGEMCVEKTMADGSFLRKSLLSEEVHLLLNTFPPTTR